MKRMNKIAIIGVGLIGGSIGLAVKDKKLAKEVVGVGHRKSSIDEAVRLKTVDRGTLDITEGVKGADIVILATPVLTMAGLVGKAAPYLKRGCVVTDVGSTKRKVCREIEKLLPEGVSFVGGHPMAGSEKRGVETARKGLFKGSLCIVTKGAGTKPKPLKAVKDLWSSLGAEVVVLSPEAHDRIVSGISHLPHMVAFAMMNFADKGSLKFASSGFSDVTRIASSDAGIWKDIAVSNRDEILKSISKFKKSLVDLEGALRRRDAAALLKIFNRAKAKRELLV